MIFFSSDSHLGHDNIRDYCNRPFDSVEEMDEALIHAWNDVVSPPDTVFHLGDFTLGTLPQATDYFSQLNGHIYILSNSWHHDRQWLFTMACVVSKGGHEVRLLHPMHICDRFTTPPSKSAWAAAGYPIVLCHYPLAVWDRKHYGAWHLHGHSHGNYRALGSILDVGVDNAYKLLGAYRPFGIVEVSKAMKGVT